MFARIWLPMTIFSFFRGTCVTSFFVSMNFVETILPSQRQFGNDDLISPPTYFLFHDLFRIAQPQVMASVPSIFGKGSGGNGIFEKNRESIYRRRGSRDRRMNRMSCVLGRRGNHMRLVVIILVGRAAQTLSRGETAFWNPRLRRHEREMLAFRRREDAGRHRIALGRFWTEGGRHSHAVLVFQFL